MSSGGEGDSAHPTSAHTFAHTTTKPISTNTNLVLNHDCHIQSFYEYFLQS